MYAQNGRVRIYYELSGGAHAPALVLIRGLARTIHHWGEMVERLQDDFRIVALDNRGVGKSSTPLPPYTTAWMANDTAAVLSHSGVERAHIFGISLGGMIAQELALSHSERVQRLVLGCTRAGLFAGSPMSLAATARLVGAGRLRPDRAMDYTAPYILSEAFMRARPDVLETWRRLALEDPPRRSGVFGQMLAGLLHNSVSRLTKIQKPTLILTGDADRLFSPACSRYLARCIPGARLQILPGAGHDFPIELPAETAQAIKQHCLT